MRYSRPNPAHRLIAYVVAVALAGCATPHDSLATLAGGEASFALEVLGGWSPYRFTTFVDSAAGRWEKVRCSPTQSSSPCRSSDVVAAGVISPDRINRLFSALRTPAFRAIPDQIPGGGGPEVDGSLYTLTFDDGGTPRLVQWRSLAPLPAPLEAFLTALDSATTTSWR